MQSHVSPGELSDEILRLSRYVFVLLFVVQCLPASQREDEIPHKVLTTKLTLCYLLHSSTFKQPSLWPTLLHVAEDRGKIVGYVLAKLDEESPKVAKGHITSLSVLRTHRKLGIAAKLMIAANDALMTTYKTESCSLHVRVSNKAALHLYVDTLGYENTGTEKAYYADGEDAHNMRLTFKYGLKDQGLTDDELKVLERLGLLDVK